MTKTQKYLLGILLLSLGILKLLLTNKGHFFLQDELRYRYSLAFLREILEADFVGALKQMYQRHLMLRPGLVIVNLPPAILQVILDRKSVV